MKNPTEDKPTSAPVDPIKALSDTYANEIVMIGYDISQLEKQLEEKRAQRHELRGAIGALIRLRRELSPQQPPKTEG